MQLSIGGAARAAIAVAALASGCLISPVMSFGGGKSAKQVQHETVRELTPPALTPLGAWRGEVRTAIVRVWADDEYRAQNGRWREAFQQVLDDADEILAAEYGVRLVADFHPWDHHAPGAPLSESLEALAAQDPGDGAFAVIGLTSSTPLTTGNFEQLGLAEMPGRHLIVRGYADLEERAAFERAFPDVAADEKSALYDARRHHRNAAVLLHELGHDLGAPHRGEADTLMSSIYSDRSTSFDPDSHALIQASVDARLGRAASSDSARPAGGAHALLVVVIRADGQRVVGGNEVDDRTFDERLRLAAKDDPDTQLVLRAEPGASPDLIHDALVRARRAGLHHVETSSGR